MTILDLHDLAAKLQEQAGADQRECPPGEELLVKALLQAIHEIDVLNDRINRLEAATVINPNDIAAAVPIR